jgi:hypothetical protein
MDSLGTLSDEVAANSDCFGFAFLARGTLKHFEFKRGVLKSCTKYKLCWAGDKEKEGKSFIISPPLCTRHAVARSAAALGKRSALNGSRVANGSTERRRIASRYWSSVESKLSISCLPLLLIFRPVGCSPFSGTDQSFVYYSNAIRLSSIR